MVRRKRRKIKALKGFQTVDKDRGKVFNYRKLFLNVAFFVSILLIIYFSYGLLKSEKVETKDTNLVSNIGDVSKNEENIKSVGKVYTVQVLNGCGVKGVAERFTDFLRKSGFDVKEYGNYSPLGIGDSYYFDIRETIVIDRSGEYAPAKIIANSIGTENVIKQISKDLLIDVTVIIGKDYKNMAPYK
jgi:hypothetical protein